MISLKRGNGDNWSPSQPPIQDAQVNVPVHESVSSAVAASVAGNVSSFLSGIRATFRQENVIVAPSLHSKQSSKEISNHVAK